VDEHGTAVLGETASVPNAYGCSGMVPDADVYTYPEHTVEGGARRLAAITNAIAGSRAGDVVLLEMQMSGAGGGYGPAEVDPSVWLATRTGTDAGVVVVAAAGNGQNLDSRACRTRCASPCGFERARSPGARSPALRRSAPLEGRYRLGMKNIALALSAVLVTCAASTALAAQEAGSDWPQFRGVGARGVRDGAELPLEFGAPSWRVAVPGLSHASPVVLGERVFVVTAVPAVTSCSPHGLPTIVSSSMCAMSAGVSRRGAQVSCSSRSSENRAIARGSGWGCPSR
jgi:hypothetical protein